MGLSFKVSVSGATLPESFIWPLRLLVDDLIVDIRRVARVLDLTDTAKGWGLDRLPADTGMILPGQRIGFNRGGSSSDDCFRLTFLYIILIEEIRLIVVLI